MEQDGADHGADRDAKRATCGVDGHRHVLVLVVDDRVGVDGAEGVEGAGAKPREGGEEHEEREAWREADRGEEDCRPCEGEAGEAGAIAVGEPAEERLRDRRGTGIRQGNHANGLEVEVEPIGQDRIQDRQEAAVHVDGEVATGEGHERLVQEYGTGR